MANICNNDITFFGSNSYKAYEEYINEYCFDEEVYSNDGRSIHFYCGTKWVPQIEILQTLCKKWSIDCDIKYNEIGFDFSGHASIDSAGELLFDDYYSFLQGFYIHDYESFEEMVSDKIENGDYESFDEFKDEFSYMTEDHLDHFKSYF